ncbi:MAG: hypothetical protein M1165_02190 [Candidatus Pacearchaeota archaeon]|nr:hypothetical protein [Candidatus Pacearchaeota archaeon]
MGGKIHPLYTGRGDAGYTKDLLGARTGKESALIQLMSKIDSLQGAIDVAISESFGREKVILKRVQGKLWQAYPMIQDPENMQGYTTNPVNKADLHRIESYIWEAQKYVKNMNLSGLRLTNFRL